MPANSTLEPAIDDPAEVAYWHHRKVVRRRQLVAILATITLTLGVLGRKAGTHAVVANWLGWVHYRVVWDIDRENWKHGGATRVSSGYSSDSFPGSRVNCELRYLPWLQRIEELDLSLSFGLKDEELTWLADLEELRSLNLDRTSHPEWQVKYPLGLTDSTLDRIGSLKKLRVLDLGGQQQITDAGLANLAKLDLLESLNLHGTTITDAGLERLKFLPSLKSLDVEGTKVSAQGLAEFEASRPLVKVLSDPLPMPPPKPKR